MNGDGAIYTGTVRHRRFAPRTRAFAQPLYCLYLDVDAVERTVDRLRLLSRSRFAPLSFRRSDYLGPAELSIGRAVRRELASKTGREHEGRIYMLTQVRSFGHIENPVTFYYAFHATEPRVQHVIAEITNTPWRERHRYVLTADENLGDERTLRFRFDKAFHVSPFQPMDLAYDWRFTTPRDGLVVHMLSHRGGAPHFDATLTLERRPLCDEELARVLLRQPCMSARIAIRTYAEAARLYLRGHEFHAHPGERSPRGPCPAREVS
jgi:uncharacterized protein